MKKNIYSKKCILSLKIEKKALVKRKMEDGRDFRTDPLPLHYRGLFLHGKKRIDAMIELCEEILQELVEKGKD